MDDALRRFGSGSVRLMESLSTNSVAVSIVLPTYNRARFLPEAFESIRAQKFTRWELIVIDDGSTDETRAVVAALSADLPQPARYHYQANQGPAAARNAGIDLTQEKYIAFYDSDDL